MGNNDEWDIAAWGALFVLVLLAVFAGIYWYDHHRGAANALFVAFAYDNAWLFTHFPRASWFPAFWRDDIIRCQGVLLFLAHHTPAQITGRQMYYCLRITTAPWRYISPLAFFPLAVLAYYDAGALAKCRRRYSMRELMRTMSLRFPALRPALLVDFLKPSTYTTGPWRVSMAPIEWAWQNKVLYQIEGSRRRAIPRHWIFRESPKNNLLFNLSSPLLRDAKVRSMARLDTERANALLTKQLGGPWTSWEALPYYARALVAAFAAFATDKDGRVAGQALLDAINRSVVVDDQDRPTITPPDDQVRALWKKYGAEVMATEEVAHHLSYWRPCVVGFVRRARKSGTLPCSQFLWLRAIDRTLWYALNQQGGRRPWIEAMGIWAHYEAEEEIKQAIIQPEMLDAVDWLRTDLVKAGWIDDVASQEEGWNSSRTDGATASPKTT